MYWVEEVAGTSPPDIFSLLLAQSYHFPDWCSLASGPASIPSDDQHLPPFTCLSARKPLSDRRRIIFSTSKLGDLMSIAIHPDLESRIRSRAEAQHLTI